MIKFEYLLATLTINTGGAGTLDFISEPGLSSELEGKSTDQVVNRLGEQGWELVSPPMQPTSAVVYLIFKRIRSEAQQIGGVSYYKNIWE